MTAKAMTMIFAPPSRISASVQDRPRPSAGITTQISKMIDEDSTPSLLFAHLDREMFGIGVGKRCRYESCLRCAWQFENERRTFTERRFHANITPQRLHAIDNNREAQAKTTGAQLVIALRAATI